MRPSHILNIILKKRKKIHPFKPQHYLNSQKKKNHYTCFENEKWKDQVYVRGGATEYERLSTLHAKYKFICKNFTKMKINNEYDL